LGLIIIILAVTLVFALLGPAFDVSRNVANLSPEQQAEAEQLFEDLVKAIDEERYADAEQISSKIDEFNQKALEGLSDAQSKIICAWCGTVIGKSDTPEDTHSVCKACKSSLIEDWEE